MSEHEHPSAVALESLAAGDESPAAKAHLETCASCTEYVASLRSEAAAFAAAPPPAFLADLEALAANDGAAVTSHHTSDAAALPPSAVTDAHPRRADVVAIDADRRRRRVTTFVYGALPLAIAAAAFFVLRPSGVPSDPSGLPLPPAESTMTLKGPPVLAVVRERGGEQERFTGNVAVAPNDRLRLELTVDRAGTYEAGLLGEDGSWIVLLAPTTLSPGAHFSEKAARLDDKPTPGLLVAGSPEDVARARATRNFRGLAMVPVEVTRQ